jgi:hypothetical protein
MDVFAQGDACQLVILDQAINSRISRKGCEQARSHIPFVGSRERRTRD